DGDAFTWIKLAEHAERGVWENEHDLRLKPTRMFDGAQTGADRDAVDFSWRGGVQAAGHAGCEIQRSGGQGWLAPFHFAVRRCGLFVGDRDNQYELIAMAALAYAKRCGHRRGHVLAQAPAIRRRDAPRRPRARPAWKLHGVGTEGRVVRLPCDDRGGKRARI